MPSMANLTVKKYDNVTDIVYDMLSASPGDNGFAFWRQDTGAAAGLPIGLRALLAMQTKWNGPKTARQARINYSYPYAVQDTTTTLYSAKDRFVLELFATIPQNMPATAINEATSQGCNLIAQSLIKASMQAGYAPT